TPSESRQGSRIGIAFAQGIPGPGEEALPAVDPTRRPADLDVLDAWAFAEAEVEPRIVGGQVAAATDTLRHLAPAASGDGDPSPDAIAVGSRSLEAEREESAGLVSPVVEIGEGAVLGDDHGIDPPVVVQVARGEATPDTRHLPGGTGLV